MKQGKTIKDVQKKFTHIVNHLKGLGKIFEEKEINVKVLKSLNRTWLSKVTTISESKNLATMTHAELFGKLREYDVILARNASLDTSHRVWMTPLPKREDKSG